MRNSSKKKQVRAAETARLIQASIFGQPGVDIVNNTAGIANNRPTKGVQAITKAVIAKITVSTEAPGVKNGRNWSRVCFGRSSKGILEWSFLPQESHTTKVVVFETTGIKPTSSSLSTLSSVRAMAGETPQAGQSIRIIGPGRVSQLTDKPPMIVSPYRWRATPQQC